MVKINQLSSIWETERLSISDSREEDVPELQLIDEAVPEVYGWTEVESEEQQKHEMLEAVLHGALPPGGIRERFRLQSIRVKPHAQIIGFLVVYLGFPEEDILWINVLAFHPHHQSRGYGRELMEGLCEQARALGSIRRMRLSVSLQNLHGLGFWIRCGFERIILFKDVKSPPDVGRAHMVLEKAGLDQG